MTENDLKELIAEALKITTSELEEQSGENWDSLDHLTILVRLDAILSGATSAIAGIESCFSYHKIMNKLKENGIVK